MRPACDRLQAEGEDSRRSRSARSSLPRASRRSTPSRLPVYGYGKYPNVYTSLEVERLVNASGPTSGELILRDGRRPKTVGIIHCVGSRDRNTNRWCSRTCCMYSLKLAHLLKEHTDAEVYNFYIDIRAAGKTYEEFYDKLLEENVHFIRGRVAEVTDWAARPSEEEQARHPRRRHHDRHRAPHPGGHGGAGGRHGATSRFAGCAQAVQYLLLDRRILPGAPSEAGPGGHLHRRCLHCRGLPGPEGYPRQRGTGRRRRGTGPGPDRFPGSGTGAQRRLYHRGRMLGLQIMPYHLPVQGHRP